MGTHEIARRLIGGRWRTVDATENGNGGSQSVQRAYLRLTPTNIGQPAFTPFEIVAGITGTALVPVGGICNYVGGTTPYDGGSEEDTDVQVVHGDPVIAQDICLTSNPQAFWADTVAYSAALTAPSSTSQAVVTVTDLPLNVTLNNSNPLATGNIPLDVWVWYIAHDLSDLT